MEILTKTARTFYGIGMAGIGIQQFSYPDFRPVILPSWPSSMHASAIWAYIVGAALIIAGAFIVPGKKARVTSLLLGGFLFVLFIAFQCSFVLFIQPNSPRHLGLWTDPLKELALSGGAFVMAGLFSEDELPVSHKNYLFIVLGKFIPFGRIFFSITMISFGIDHFFYTDFVATLVPSWIPDHLFWTYFAAVALISSGVAIILKIKIKPVALLLSTMLFLWVILLHIPRAIANPYVDNGNEITSVFEALAFSGIALGIANMHKSKNSEIKITLSKS
jgi:uncharacterized membrane protein YphA (DoxX/SURF4 family)